MKQLHFCGGLPRTGSTVLMNILQQNPEIFTTASDVYPEILNEQILIKSRYRVIDNHMWFYRAFYPEVI